MPDDWHEFRKGLGMGWCTGKPERFARLTSVDEKL